MSPTPGIDRRTAQQLKGECCYGTCHETHAEDSDYCIAHQESEGARGRSKQAARRLKLARVGECRDGCGAKVGKRYVSGRIVPRSCGACAKADRERLKARRERAGSNYGSSVPTSSTTNGHFKIEERSTARADGTPHKAHVRYVGRAHRGGPTRDELDADMLRDARRARSLLLHFEEKGLSMLRSIEEQQPTSSQRAEARILASDPVGQAFRLAVSVFVAVHPDGKRGVQDWFTSYLSGE